MKEEITTANKRKSIKLFFGIAGASLFIATILLFAVFGLWNYLYPSFTPYLVKINQKNSVPIQLTGKEGLYFISLPTQKIQLIEPSKNIRFLEVQITLTLHSAKGSNEVIAAIPVLQDATISYLRNTRIQDLQEAGFLFNIKEALLNRFNSVLEPIQIQDILFQKILLQEETL